VEGGRQKEKGGLAADDVNYHGLEPPDGKGGEREKLSHFDHRPREQSAGPILSLVKVCTSFMTSPFSFFLGSDSGRNGKRSAAGKKNRQEPTKEKLENGLAQR